MTSAWFNMNLSFQDKFSVPTNHFKRSSDTYGEHYGDSSLSATFNGPPSSAYIPMRYAKTPGINGRTIVMPGMPNYGQTLSPSQSVSWTPAGPMSSMTGAGYQSHGNSVAVNSQGAHRYNLGNIFMQFDADGDGFLDIGEFQRAFRAIGLKKRSGAKMEVDQAMFNSFDTNGDGMISIAEFEENLYPKTRAAIEAKLDEGWVFDQAKWDASVARHSRWDMSKVFKQFDFDADGFLDLGELKRAFRALGLKKRSGGKLEFDEEMFKSFDTNGDGVVSLEEFEANLWPKTRKKIEARLNAGWKFDPQKWADSLARHARWDMSKIFKQFDADGDGKLSISEFARAFRALGLKKRSGADLEVDHAMFDSFDTNGDGFVSLPEIEQNLYPKTRKKIEEKLRAGWKFDKPRWDASVARHKRWDMAKVFKQFDADKDGFLDQREFMRAFRALGLPKRGGQKMAVDLAMFNSFDTNGDGVVSLEEFENNLHPKTRVKIEQKLDAGWKFDPELWQASLNRHKND